MRSGTRRRPPATTAPTCEAPSPPAATASLASRRSTPGWYAGRTVHIHLKAHIDKQTVLTTQLFFDEKLNSAVFKTSPYDERGGRTTFNDGDSIYDKTGQLAVTKRADGYLGVINLGINA